MRCGTYDRKRSWESGCDFSDAVVLFELDTVEIGAIYMHGGKAYVPCMLDSRNNFARLEEIPLGVPVSDDSGDGDLEEYADSVKCPVCGNTTRDELQDSDDSFECGMCMATLSYERYVSVDYTTTLVKRPEIIVVPEVSK